MKVSFQKNIFEFDTIILISFTSGGCIDEVVDNGANYQEYECDVYFVHCHLLAVIHFMNGEVVCNIIRRIIFHVYICFNHSLM